MAQAPAMAAPGDAAHGFTRLVASAPLHADADVAARLLADGAAVWLHGSVERPEVAGIRRYAVDLRLHVGGDAAGLMTFSKAAFLDLGPLRRTPGGWEVEVSWRASTAAPLFPVFSGWLKVDRRELRIDGFYAPPGGVIGRVADRVLLHLAANGTARWLLRELDRSALRAAR